MKFCKQFIFNLIIFNNAVDCKCNKVMQNVIAVLR